MEFHTMSMDWPFAKRSRSVLQSHQHAWGPKQNRRSLPKFAAGLVQGLVALELVVRVLAVIGDSLAVVRVFLDVPKKPTDGLLVVVVLLALDDDLRQRLAFSTGQR